MADKYTVTALDSNVYTNTANWVGGVAPIANDDVFFQFTSTSGLAGSDQSATELDDIEVLSSCTGPAGSADTYLQLDQGTANNVVFAGLGVWYLDMGTAGSASVRVDQTANVSDGNAGLYFKNNTNAITTFEVNGGTVRLVNANVTTLVVREGATAYIDTACTVGTVVCDGGTVVDYGCGLTTWDHISGTGTKHGSDAYTVNVYGGTLYNNGTGDCTANVYGGMFDSASDGRSKNVTLTYYGGTALLGNNVSLTDTFNAAVQITQAV